MPCGSQICTFFPFETFFPLKLYFFLRRPSFCSSLAPSFSPRILLGGARRGEKEGGKGREGFRFPGEFKIVALLFRQTPVSKPVRAVNQAAASPPPPLPNLAESQVDERRRRTYHVTGLRRQLSRNKTRHVKKRERIRKKPLHLCVRICNTR